jgi:hypothetical protein
VAKAVASLVGLGMEGLQLAGTGLSAAVLTAVAVVTFTDDRT